MGTAVQLCKVTFLDLLHDVDGPNTPEPDLKMVKILNLILCVFTTIEKRNLIIFYPNCHSSIKVINIFEDAVLFP